MFLPLVKQIPDDFEVIDVSSIHPSKVGAGKIYPFISLIDCFFPLM
jgi:hypothetical protein